MKRAADGKPLCGSSANELGLRPGVDVTEDSNGLVQPETGGLSTTPDDPSLLPPHVRPPSFGGKGKLPVFVLDVAVLNDKLSSRRDPKHPRSHAFIEPRVTMTLTVLQEILGAGRGNWEIVP